MKKKLPKPKRKDVGTPNPHRRLQLILTPKQVEKVFEALRSTASLRGEAESLYFLKIMKDCQRQMVLNDFFELAEAIVPR